MTMIEIMAVLLTIASGLCIGLLSLSQTRPSFQRAHIREQFRGDILLAQSQAISERARVILRMTANGYELGIDYPPYSTTGSIDAESPLREKRKLSPHFTLEMEPVNFLVFDSRGNLIDDITGRLTESVVRLKYDGEPFLEGTVYPTGVIQ